MDMREGKQLSSMYPFPIRTCGSQKHVEFTTTIIEREHKQLSCLYPFPIRTCGSQKYAEFTTTIIELP